jgi:biopolymer transport protein TolR
MAFSGGPNSAEINITPLIDILLVLIIVFMVVVSMSKQQGEEAQIPQPAQDSSIPPPERTIVIELRVNREAPPDLKINERNVSWKELQEKLNDIFAGRVEKVAFIQADKDVLFEPIAEVIDSAHAAGVAHVGLITRPLPQMAQARR